MELVVLRIIIIIIGFGIGWIFRSFNEERKQKKRNIPIFYRKLFNEDKKEEETK